MSDQLHVEKLVHIAGTFIRPSAVNAIEPRLLGGCDVYLAGGDGRKPTKLFVPADPAEVAARLGLS